MTRSWAEFRVLARPQADWSGAGTILCLDPGETTGVAIFKEGNLFLTDEVSTLHPSDMAVLIRDVHTSWRIDHLVYEEYRVRGNKYKEHVGSEVVTIQLIGVIKAVADELHIPTTKQSAGMAKAFATDTKLRRWGLFQTGMRHANDAVRHGLHYLLFNYALKGPHR